MVLTVRRVYCGFICGGGIGKKDGLRVWVEMREKMLVFMSALG